MFNVIDNSDPYEKLKNQQNESDMMYAQAPKLNTQNIIPEQTEQPAQPAQPAQPEQTIPNDVNSINVDDNVLDDTNDDVQDDVNDTEEEEDQLEDEEEAQDVDLDDEEADDEKPEPPKVAQKEEPVDLSYKNPLTGEQLAIDKKFSSIKDKKTLDEIKQLHADQITGQALAKHYQQSVDQVKKAQSESKELQEKYKVLNEDKQKLDNYKKQGKDALLYKLIKDHGIEKHHVEAWLDKSDILEMGNETDRNRVMQSQRAWDQIDQETIKQNLYNNQQQQQSKIIEQQKAQLQQMQQQAQIQQQQMYATLIKTGIQKNPKAQQINEFLSKSFNDPNKLFKEIVDHGIKENTSHPEQSLNAVVEFWSPFVFGEKQPQKKKVQTFPHLVPSSEKIAVPVKRKKKRASAGDYLKQRRMQMQTA